MPHVLQFVDTLKQTVLGLSSIEVPVAKIFQEAALNHFHLCCFRDRKKTWGKRGALILLVYITGGFVKLENM